MSAKNKKGHMSKVDKQRRRKAVVLRDGPGCHWCGSDDDSTLDHVIPRSAGGSNKIGNLVLACPTCNLRRGGVHSDAAGPGMVGLSTGSWEEDVVAESARALLEEVLDEGFVAYEWNAGRAVCQACGVSAPDGHPFPPHTPKCLTSRIERFLEGAQRWWVS